MIECFIIFLETKNTNYPHCFTEKLTLWHQSCNTLSENIKILNLRSLIVITITFNKVIKIHRFKIFGVQKVEP